MSVLVASGLRKEHLGTPLFDGVSFAVGRRDRLSLAGPNGAGKTTLLRALAGETSLQSGELAFAKGARVALHDQRPPLDFDVTLREYAFSGARDLLAAEEDLRRLEQAMAGGAHAELTLRRYADAQARLEHAGGWAWRERAAAAIRGLGFADEQLDRPLGTFSGGELTRASLARVLAAQPDLLLLDEPTNHLDLESREALESALEAFPGAVLLVSHDRALLDAVPDRIVAIEERRLRSYDGGWADVQALAAAPKPPPERSRSRPRKGPAARVAELEAQLASDWTNVDVLSAHRAARDELARLLERWEALFGEAGT